MRKNIKKDSKAISTILIVAVVVVVIVIAAVGAYWYMSQNPAAPSDSTTPTPTAMPPSTESPSTSDISSASSLQYSVSVTGEQQAMYTFMGKGIGTDDFAMRIEYTDDTGENILIFNGATQEAWTYSGGEWVDISDYFTSQWDIWDSLWSGYTNSLSDWAGTGDYTYSDGNTSVTIYDVSVNPTLADSLFTHS